MRAAAQSAAKFAMRAAESARRSTAVCCRYARACGGVRRQRYMLTRRYARAPPCRQTLLLNVERCRGLGVVERQIEAAACLALFLFLFSFQRASARCHVMPCACTTRGRPFNGNELAGEACVMAQAAMRRWIVRNTGAYMRRAPWQKRESAANIYRATVLSTEGMLAEPPPVLPFSQKRAESAFTAGGHRYKEAEIIESGVMLLSLRRMIHMPPVSRR